MDTPFVEQRKSIDRSSAVYRFEGSLELLHADIADIQFAAKYAVDPKYCLLVVDLFNSKIYKYPLKKKAVFLLKNLSCFMKICSKIGK